MSKNERPLIDTDIEAEAVALVKGEVAQWENAIAWVTDKVAFQMRDLIRTLRKNYWGVFDNPTDPTTGRKKIWVPLTHSLCDAVTKNIDLDQKDVNVRAKKAESVPTASLVRALVKNYLDKMYFGEHIDEMERQLAIDGTVVWKTIEQDGEPKKINVDLLNFYIDPSEENIQSAFRVTERALLTPEQVKAMDGWINTDVTPSVSVARTDKDMNSTNSGASHYVDVYEMWGQIPKRLITGRKKDTEMVSGHIVVSGLEGTGPKVHLIEENKNELKPYEEVRYTRVTGRWYGVGVAEKIMMLQLWLNTIVNIRINRSYVSQLGLFLIKRGAGITPQMISRLGSNGGILVNNTDDIQQLVMQEASQASYQDEQNIVGWARQVTSAFEVVTGEQLPSSTTATAIATQSTGAMSQFSMVKKGIGMFFQRWIDRHCIPIIAKNIKLNDIIRVAGDDVTEEITERVAAFMAATEVEAAFERGEIPTEQDVLNFIEKAKAEIQRQPSLFVQAVQKLAADDVETQVYVTDEELNSSVVVTNLINMLNIVQATRPDIVEPTVRQIYDILGLQYPKSAPKPQMPMIGADYQSMQNPTTPTEQLTKSATFDNAQTPQY